MYKSCTHTLTHINSCATRYQIILKRSQRERERKRKLKMMESKNTLWHVLWCCFFGVCVCIFVCACVSFYFNNSVVGAAAAFIQLIRECSMRIQQLLDFGLCSALLYYTLLSSTQLFFTFCSIVLCIVLIQNFVRYSCSFSTSLLFLSLLLFPLPFYRYNAFRLPFMYIYYICPGIIFSSSFSFFFSFFFVEEQIRCRLSSFYLKKYYMRTKGKKTEAIPATTNDFNVLFICCLCTIAYLKVEMRRTQNVSWIFVRIVVVAAAAASTAAVNTFCVVLQLQ